MQASQLIGAWALTGFEARSDGHVSYPYTETAEGLLCYMADGYMCAFLAHPAFRGVQSITAETAILSSNYSGRWRIEGDTVFHEVLFANVPQLIGQTLARGVTFSSPDDFELRTLEQLALYPGAEQILRWTRRPRAA